MRILSGDLFIFSLLILLYIRLQKKFPNFFYPLSGIVILLPPDEQLSTNTNLKDYKEKKGKSKNQGQPINFYKGTYEKLKNLVYSSDIEFIIMFSLISSIHLLISELFKNFLSDYYKETLILLFLCIFFASYSIKILLLK